MRIFLVLLSLALTASSGFGSKLKVVASTPDLAEFVRAVGKDRVEVDFIVRGNQNPHYVDIKPSYMMKLRSADAFVIVGMQLELWAPQIIDGSRNANLMIIDCSRPIAKLEVPTGKIDASQGDVHPHGNPHYWLDPENVPLILGEIVEGLSKLSGVDAAFFRANADAYARELAAAVVEWENQLAPYRGRPMVTYHSSFSYFAHRFGLNIIGYVEPKPGIAPTPSHVNELIQRMKKTDVCAIGLEQFYEEKIPSAIAKAAGAQVVRLSTSVGGREGIDTYRKLMDHNVRSLADAFKAHH